MNLANHELPVKKYQALAHPYLKEILKKECRQNPDWGCPKLGLCGDSCVEKKQKIGMIWEIIRQDLKKKLSKHFPELGSNENSSN